MSLDPVLRRFNPDKATGPAFGLRVQTGGHASELREHSHRQGQLILALQGGLTCQVPDAWWVVPPGRAVWVPWQMPHSIRTTANAQLCYLFVQPGAAALPDHACTLTISPLVRELVIDMARQPGSYPRDSALWRKALVLLDELMRLPEERLQLPMSSEPRLRTIATMLADDPADRRTLAQWAQHVGMGERSLARLVQKETGLSFGRWRQQLHLIVALHKLAAGTPVQNIAADLGYASVTAFIGMFKKAFGSSPTRYLASLQQGHRHVA